MAQVIHLLIDLESPLYYCNHIAGDELSDTEDPDLLAELQGMQGDNNSGPGTPSKGGRHPIRQEDEDGVGHSLLQTIQDRIGLYREAEQVATAQGEGGKARRAARGLRTLQVDAFSILGGCAFGALPRTTFVAFKVEDG